MGVEKRYEPTKAFLGVGRKNLRSMTAPHPPLVKSKKYIFSCVKDVHSGGSGLTWFNPKSSCWSYEVKWVMKPLHNWRGCDDCLGFQEYLICDVFICCLANYCYMRFIMGGVICGLLMTLPLVCSHFFCLVNSILVHGTAWRGVLWIERGGLL